MKKILIQFLVLLFSSSIYSQGVFFNFGKNFTTFSYKNRSPFAEKLNINGVGDNYEIGYSNDLKYKNLKYLKYSGSFTINDFNGTAISNSNNIVYNTTYLGVQGSIDYQFYESFYFFLSAKAGLNFSTLVRGKQTINDAVYDLVKNNEFSGLFVHPFLGVQAKYYLTKNGYLSAGLNFSKGIKIGNNDDNISINNTQILFGGYFDLIKR